MAERETGSQAENGHHHRHHKWVTQQCDSTMWLNWPSLYITHQLQQLLSSLLHKHPPIVNQIGVPKRLAFSELMMPTPGRTLWTIPQEVGSLQISSIFSLFSSRPRAPASALMDWDHKLHFHIYLQSTIIQIENWKTWPQLFTQHMDGKENEEKPHRFTQLNPFWKEHHLLLSLSLVLLLLGQTYYYLLLLLFLILG